MHDPLSWLATRRRTGDATKASSLPSSLFAGLRSALAMALLFSAVACRGQDVVSPLEPSLQASVQDPSVTLTEWSGAVDIFQIADYGVKVWAHSPGHITNPAQIHVWTQGRIVGVFIPALRHDVFYTVRVNGRSSSSFVPGPMRWTGDGFSDDFYTIHALNCGVQGNESISAYSTHWARWGASLRGIPLSKTVGPARTKVKTSRCPPQEEEDCEEDAGTGPLLATAAKLSFVLSEDAPAVRSGAAMPLPGSDQALVGGLGDVSPSRASVTRGTCSGGGNGDGRGVCGFETICIDIWHEDRGWVEYWCGSTYVCTT